MDTDLTIADLDGDNADLIQQIVHLLELCFSQFSPRWLPTDKDRLIEVQKSLAPNRRSRVLLNANQQVLGWIGAIKDENLWEIHPIAIHPEFRKQGLGMRLITDVMSLARQSGAVAIWAGTSDETESSSLSREDLYADPFGAISRLDVEENHALNFWRKTGFTLVGVLPDAEGLDKPGIHFAKRL